MSTALLIKIVLGVGVGALLCWMIGKIGEASRD